MFCEITWKCGAHKFVGAVQLNSLNITLSLEVATPTPRPFSGRGCHALVSDIAIFVLKRDVKLQLTRCHALTWRSQGHSLSAGDDVTGRQPGCGRDFAS